MTTIDRFAEAQAAWDGIAGGDATAAFEGLAPDVEMWHGPGAGPFAGHGVGTDRLIEMAIYFDQVFAGTWRQDGRCVYADDRCAISLVHETGDAPDGGRFDNQALWISRFGAGGKVDAVWTVDLDAEQVQEFWAGRGGQAS